MSLIKTPLEKAAGVLEVCTRRLTDFQAEREVKEAQAKATVDFDHGFAIREEIAVLDRKIEAATIARDDAAVKHWRAEKDAAEAEADRRHAAAQKTARAGEKLTLDVITAAEKLADALAALEANRAEIDAANEVRGSRPFIVDGERKLREGPPREVKAVTVVDQIWVDRAGNRVSPLVTTPGPPPGCQLREVENVLQPARLDPGIMPSRLADVIRLVDLQGRQIWPSN